MPRPTIADHRIAAIARRRIGALHARDRVEDRLADLGRAHIAGEDAVAFDNTPRSSMPVHHIADMRGAEHLAGPAAIAGVIGELHGVDRPDLDADPLQRKHRGGIADMAVGDMRLDGEEIHVRCPLRMRSRLNQARVTA